MTRPFLLSLASAIAGTAYPDSAIVAVRRAIRAGTVGWKTALTKLADAMTTNEAAFRIFVKGNAKLPFYSFAALPVVTCPGRGDCERYCYSLKAFRNPNAFARWAQNTWFLRSATGRAQIRDAFLSLPQGATVRLYTDGDFDSLDTLRFWFGLLSERPDVRAYGYSKSLHLFAAHLADGYSVPSNYRLNISNGSRFASLAPGLSAEPFVRGSFTAIHTDRETVLRWRESIAQTGRATGAIVADIKRTAKENGVTGPTFVCPGLCGNCTVKGHACGSDRFDGVTIAIPVH